MNLEQMKILNEACGALDNAESLLQSQNHPQACNSYIRTQNARIALAKLIEEIENEPVETFWEDTADDYSYNIANFHPKVTGDHETYKLAQRLVSHRHSKGALVDLVNYLLRRVNP